MSARRDDVGTPTATRRSVDTTNGQFSGGVDDAPSTADAGSFPRFRVVAFLQDGDGARG